MPLNPFVRILYARARIQAPFSIFFSSSAIFLPAAECKPHCHDNTGYYWSSSLIPDVSFGPYLFAFSENGKEINDNFFRCCGFTIRAVRANNEN